MKGGRSVACGLGAKPRSDDRVAPVPGEVPLEKGTQVQTGTPDEDRKPATCLDLSHQLLPTTRELEGGECLRGVADVEKMMGNGPPFRRGRLTRPDIQAPVDLHGIGDDDLGRNLPGYRQSQRRFAHSRGARNEQNRR